MEIRFNSYSPIMLAGEDAFIRWVRYGEQDELWKKWMSEIPDASQKAAEARKIVLSLQDTSGPSITLEDKAALWNKIESGIQTNIVSSRKTHIRLLWRWTAAAAAVLVLVVWFNQLMARQQVIARTGEQKEFTLPEESQVVLNAGSKVAYAEKTFDTSREIHLEGEAFFKVKPGSTFTVKTDEGSVTVLGTSFNVIARDGRFEVSCYTGKVKVENNNHEGQLITPGQQTLKNGSGKIESKAFVPDQDHPQWINGKFTFDDQPLVVVFGELERQYGVKVKMSEDIARMRYTGLFESGDLQEALDLITWPRQLQFTIKGNIITISR